MCRSHQRLSIRTNDPAAFHAHVQGLGHPQQICQSCSNCNHHPYGATNPIFGHSQHHGQVSRDPFERLPIIGLGVQCGKWAYKSYKKNKAKKEAQEAGQRGVPRDIRDPSTEVLDSMYNHNDYPSEKGATKSTPGNHDSRRSAENSVSSTDVQDLLERDPEFRDYMERQRQIYLNQRDGRDGSFVELDSPSQDHPPAYDATMAQDGTHGSHTTHRALSDETPQSPAVSELRGSEIKELVGSPVTSVAPSEGTMGNASTLVPPAIEYPRHSVELPAVAA